MRKILIASACVALIAAAAIAAAPVTVDLVVTGTGESPGDVTGWLQMGEYPRVELTEVPVVRRFKAPGFAMQVEAPRELHVRGTVRLAGLRIGSVAARGHKLELEGDRFGVQVRAR